MPESIAIDGLISDGDWVESKDQDPNGSIRLIQLADIGDGEFKNKSARFLSSEGAEALNCTFLQAGDVLIARLPEPLGRACLFPDIGQPAVTVVDICLIRTGKKTAISNKLLTYWVNSPLIRDLIFANASGTTRTRITRKKLELFELPIPPLAEQKVIVDKIDALLRQVETIKNRLERIPEMLKRLRQTILTAAVSGKLTEDWREHNRVTPPKLTWKSALEITYAFEIPKQWVGVSLGSVSDRVSVGHVGKTSEFYTTEKNGIPFLRSQNVRPGAISLEGLAYITPEFHRSLKKSQLKPGDLLVVRVGANRGDACVLPPMFSEVNCANIVFARPMDGLSEYLNIYFQSPILQSLLLDETVGGAQGVINTKSIESTFIALPPIEEQTEIVRRVEAFFTYAQTIEQKSKTALANVNKLTQSILAKGFRGELTADWRVANSDLIRGENSAEAVLEKIKKERETIEKQPKLKRTTVKKKTGSCMSKQIIKVAEALKQAGEPLSGQQLLVAAGYASDSSTDQLEQFFLDIRNALAVERSIVKLERDSNGQDWFALAKDS
ncbi:restriction endonuclease subunit S [Acinetobacter baumannii]|nr:restriction endonuclease subunit S [Acinetobacter baumannii]